MALDEESKKRIVVVSNKNSGTERKNREAEVALEHILGHYSSMFEHVVIETISVEQHRSYFDNIIETGCPLPDIVCEKGGDGTAKEVLELVLHLLEICPDPETRESIRNMRFIIHGKGTHNLIDNMIQMKAGADLRCSPEVHLEDVLGASAGRLPKELVEVPIGGIEVNGVPGFMAVFGANSYYEILHREGVKGHKFREIAVPLEKIVQSMMRHRKHPNSVWARPYRDIFVPRRTIIKADGEIIYDQDANLVIISRTPTSYPLFGGVHLKILPDADSRNDAGYRGKIYGVAARLGPHWPIALRYLSGAAGRGRNVPKDISENVGEFFYFSGHSIGAFFPEHPQRGIIDGDKAEGEEKVGFRIRKTPTYVTFLACPKG